MDNISADLSATLRNPGLGRLMAWRMFWVSAIKSRAIRILHKSREGELLLLRMYFLAEMSTVSGIAHDINPLPMPEWLPAINRQHLEEEGQHIRWFAEALRERGATVPKVQHLDWLSRHKVKKWLNIAEDYRQQFTHGSLVPAYGIGLCAEQMAIRVLERHCRAIGVQHRIYPLLSQVRQDEAGHVEMCASVLERLIQPHETAKLKMMLAEIRRVDYSWGVATAVGLYGMACLISVRNLLPRSQRRGEQST